MKKLSILKASCEKLFILLKYVHEYAYDRDSLKEVVLELYPGKTEKSVFRGMVIPTLRHLGLIFGYKEIGLSTNGNLIFTAAANSEQEGKRALRAVLFEMDQRQQKFIEYLNGRDPVLTASFVSEQISQIEAPSIKQASERIYDWISYLKYAELIAFVGSSLRIEQSNLNEANKDLDITRKEVYFKDLLFDKYKNIISKQSGLLSVGIEDLRQSLTEEAYNNKNEIITKNQFDKLLSNISLMTPEYSITFGRSMGPEENLLFLNGAYFETITIRFIKETEK